MGTGPKSSSELSNFWDQILLGTTFFWDQIFLGPHFLGTKIFGGNLFFLGTTFFGNQNFLGRKFFLRDKIFLGGPNSFQDHFFLVTNFLLGTNIFRDQSIKLSEAKQNPAEQLAFQGRVCGLKF